MSTNNQALIDRDIQTICKEYNVGSLDELTTEDWYWIYQFQTLSEPFIRELQDKLNLHQISQYQKLSEPFIRELQDKLDWKRISRYQLLSEPFMREFQNKLHWYSISSCQTLSKSFMREFQDELYWCLVSRCQPLSKAFIAEMQHQPCFDKEVQLAKHHRNVNKKKSIKAYAKKHGLEFDGEYLHAYRNHNKWGRGAYSTTICYTSGYYRDWHCDLDPKEQNSFGLGIWPKGNTPIKVHWKDWGTEVDGDEEGKARVWGFTL
jgi:hypothetical protein